MKKTKFFKPYIIKDGKAITNIPHLKHTEAQTGVYIIRDEVTKKILYVGFSESNLYKTVYRHFQKWIDISRVEKTRFTYDKFGYEVRIIFTTKSKASILEKYLILKLNPVDNSKKYENYLSAKEINFIENELNNIQTFKGESPF